MVSRNKVAAKVAERKQLHPEKFCPMPKCLWRTPDGSLCPKHIRKNAHEKEPK